MGIRTFPSSRLGTATETITLPLNWGDMVDDSEAPLGTATAPALPTYDTAVNVYPTCDTQTNDGTTTNIWWIVIVVPSTYIDASNLTASIDGIYILGGDAVMVAATVDLEAFPYDSTNGDFSNTDICATAAQSLATTFATENFTLTGTSVTAGTTILLRFTSSIQITSAGGAGTGQCGFNFPRITFTGRE